MIVYSKSSGLNNAAYGKIETPIKMIIEHESDLLTKKGGIADWLFNIEKSNKFGETLVAQNEFDVFAATEEGGEFVQDTLKETSRKFIEHVQYTKEFVITAEMMEDANFGVAADAKRRAENFTRSYYKTMHKMCESALAGALESSTTFAGTALDLTAPDGYPLFSVSHSYTNKAGTKIYQPNNFHGNIARIYNDDEGTFTYSTSLFEEALSEASLKLRNMKDENGDPLGYTADTIVIPGNNGRFEAVVKKVCGSEGALGNGYNDINLHYGNWNVIVLPGWAPEYCAAMIMSSEANKNLGGNMLFNRVPLTVNNWVDNHTGNYIWSGRCRFGIGFGSYKHIMLITDDETSAGENLFA